MHRYSVDDDFTDGYKYTIGICTSAVATAEEGEQFKIASAIQVHKNPVDSDHPDTHIIGSFEQAEIMSGSMFHQHFFHFCNK